MILFAPILDNYCMTANDYMRDAASYMYIYRHSYYFACAQYVCVCVRAYACIIL